MAKASNTTSTEKATSVKADKTDKAIIDPSAQMEAYLKQTSDDHFNLTETVPPMRISSGSLNLDIEIGGFSEGAHRIAGGPNLGKTPFVLNIMDNFLDQFPEGRVVWCKAEGRLSDRNIARCRHPIVFSGKDWLPGTIFVFKCNTYETWINMMRNLVTNNPTKCRYGFVTDSLNAMILKNDKAKAIDEGVKVAGAPLLTTQMFQRIGLALNELGHIAFFLNQVTSEIKLNPYDKTPPRQVSGAGGNSIGHNANETLEFLNWYEGDLILKNPDERLNRINNPALGHILKVQVRKSSSEKRYVTVEIPIKYGVKGGSAIWREREIADQLLMWQLITKAGSWLTISSSLAAELASKNIPALPERIQGMNQLYALLDERKDVVDYLFDKFRSMVGNV